MNSLIDEIKDLELMGKTSVNNDKCFAVKDTGECKILKGCIICTNPQKCPFMKTQLQFITDNKKAEYSLEKRHLISVEMEINGKLIRGVRKA